MTSKERKRPGPKPRAGVAAEMIPWRIDPALIEKVRHQPDPRAFVEQAIRQALDNQGLNRRRQDIEDGIERLPFED